MTPLMMMTQSSWLTYSKYEQSQASKVYFSNLFIYYDEQVNQYVYDEPQDVYFVASSLHQPPSHTSREFSSTYDNSYLVHDEAVSVNWVSADKEH